MDVSDLEEKIQITMTLSRWYRLMDLIDIAADDVRNKRLSLILRTVAKETFKNIAPLGVFDRRDKDA